MNRSVMYWKWDNDVLDPEIMKKKADDFMSRTNIGTVFLGTQWIEDHFHGEKIGLAFRTAIDKLHAGGRKAIIECCIRNEGEPFYKQYQGEPSYLASFYEGVADKDGKGSFTVPAETVWHYWRKRGDDGEHKMILAYRLKKTGEFTFSEAIRCDENVVTKAVKNGDGYDIEVSFSGAQEGETVAVCIGFPQPLVDLAHPMLIPYFRNMAKHAKELGADGVFSDEWGYDMILKIVKPNPYDDNELNLRHVSYSEHFEKRHREFTGKPLKENLLYFFYGEKQTRSAVINDYLKSLRLLCTENEELMYDSVKEIMGEEAFWGVHPTWWGSVDSLNFEFFKNGFYWWDAKRDYAQTDEMILYAIRTALAHRFHSPVWYNMWYSMGTRDINTYYWETWRNLRFGGRTHYLGYECPNEAVVLELKPQGMLESIEEMDKRIRMFDGVVSQPDCKLLVLFGYEAVSNWADIGMEMPWKPQNPRLDYVLNTTNEIFQNILCDLVPSYATENGTLQVGSNGKAQYGTQEYDGVIVLYPNGISQKAKDFLMRLDPKKLVLCSDVNDTETQNLLKNLSAAGAKVFTERKTSAELVALVENEFGVPANRFGDEGTVMQDKSVIFTSSKGELPTGNKLSLMFEYRGNCYEFEGEDALWISADGERAIYPAGQLKRNGKAVDSCEVIK